MYFGVIVDSLVMTRLNDESFFRRDARSFIQDIY